jgi:hypothetical protein
VLWTWRAALRIASGAAGFYQPPVLDQQAMEGGRIGTMGRRLLQTDQEAFHLFGYRATRLHANRERHAACLGDGMGLLWRLAC